jgi:transcriptional regulator with XRE-family HTH domain
VTRHATQPGRHGPGDGVQIGVISGHVLKRLRGRLVVTQSQLAELLSVDINTIQGWESGRRPLSALRSFELIHIRQRLIQLGVPATAAALLPLGVEADTVLSGMAHGGKPSFPLTLHPLSSVIYRRDITNMITWPLGGTTPATLRDLPLPQNRGPVLSRPTLDPLLQAKIFDQLLEAVDQATAVGATLLRRQAAYFLGFDQRTASTDWLQREHQRALQRSGADTGGSGAVFARSASVALAQKGDQDPVRRYVAGPLSDETNSLVGLTYWAYWLGEINEVYSSDEEMIKRSATTWSGETVMSHLIDHLHASQHADINIHSL